MAAIVPEVGHPDQPWMAAIRAVVLRLGKDGLLTGAHDPNFGCHNFLFGRGRTVEGDEQTPDQPDKSLGTDDA